MACRQIKAIYRLKQSPRAWYSRIHRFFQAHDFRRSPHDDSLYINYGKQVILLLHVDALVVAAPTKALVSWIQTKFHDEFEMTDLGLLQTFLELEIARTRTKQTLHLSQSQYIQNVLRTHSLESGNPLQTLADTHVRIKKPSPVAEATPEARGQYQSAVGSVMYGMLGSRHELANEVLKVSRFSTNPVTTHWTVVKQIFGQLVRTQNRGLCYESHGSGPGCTDPDGVSSYVSRI